MPITCLMTSPSFPASVAPPDDNPLGLTFFTTQSTYSDLTTFTGAGTSTSSPRAVRYASFNVADNIATMIRKDTNISPVIFVIGLNNNNGEEALDADWLARVANDKDYIDCRRQSRLPGGSNAGPVLRRERWRYWRRAASNRFRDPSSYEVIERSRRTELSVQLPVPTSFVGAGFSFSPRFNSRSRSSTLTPCVIHSCAASSFR